MIRVLTDNKILTTAAVILALLFWVSSLHAVQVGTTAAFHATAAATGNSQVPMQPPPSGTEVPREFPGNLAETGSKVLAEVIVYLRDMALESAKPMPEKIKGKLMPYFELQLLEKVRYTTDWNPTLGAALRRFIDTDTYALAVTLDHVIVFSDEESLNNVWLWAHELKHVEQYERWGIKTFALNYLQDYQSVENEANEYAGQVLGKLRKRSSARGFHL